MLSISVLANSNSVIVLSFRPFLALKRSNELNQRRETIESRLQGLNYRRRNVWNEFKVKAAVAKNDWNRGRLEFEEEKLKETLPSYSGRAPTGTPSTQEYGKRHDSSGISQAVAGAVADVVDAVDRVSCGEVPLRKYPPPPSEEGLSAHADLEKLQRAENAYREELAAVVKDLRISEENRHRAWKKMMKTKGELGGTHHMAGMGRVTLNPSNYHSVPVPVLRQSMAERIPRQAPPAATPSYTPAVRSHVPAAESRPQSESKYSAARVRERIATDGTVAPVSEPKKTKDGLYLRPAGRTRKGMNWDAVRGIWVPAPER